MPARASTLALVCALAIAGCASGGESPAQASRRQRAALLSYLHQVEPVRLAVNRLLEGADPILSARRDGRLSGRAAGARMQALERRFADYTVQIAAIRPAGTQLAAIHAAYAHTYVLEDAYLSALAAGLAEDRLANLPDTQAAQRAAIIQWRTELTVLGARLGVALPGDLQAAGRGEIAPSPGGS